MVLKDKENSATVSETAVSVIGENFSLIPVSIYFRHDDDGQGCQMVFFQNQKYQFGKFFRA
jgi:hypothetical protein